MEKKLLLWYGITSFIFGVLLYFPMRKFMLSISINRFQRKNQRAITEEERENLKKRIYLFAAIISMTFAFLYNRVVMFRFFMEN